MHIALNLRGPEVILQKHQHGAIRVTRLKCHDIDQDVVVEVRSYWLSFFKYLVLSRAPRFLQLMVLGVYSRIAENPEMKRSNGSSST